MISGFRVQTVAIEGFKGFTNRKEIDLRGRHVFLLGRNGNGKSSILEAIRWGLFGSTRRPDEVITNRGYVGRCRVELTLVRDGKLWNLRRTLNRGTTGGSDRVLTDEHGNEHNVSEIMPQLDSVDSGEGMHIIFSAQSAPLRRPSRNLSAFERTVLHHLGLTHPRGLQAVLETFSDTSQRPAEDRLEVNLNIARANVDDQINDLERHRGRILDAQPWDGDRSPTVAESQGKARSLISEIMGSDPDSSLGGATLDALIAHAEDALQHENSLGKSALLKSLEDVEHSLEWTTLLVQVLRDIEGLHLEDQEWQKKLEVILDGRSVDEIRNNRDKERLEADTRDLHNQIVKNSIELLNRDQTGSVPCPVCGTEHERGDLEAMLEKSESTSQISEDKVAFLNELDDQVKQIEEYEREIQKIRGRVASLEQTAGVYREEASGDGSSGDILEELTPSASADKLESLRLKLLERKTELGRLIEDQQQWLRSLQIRISKLKEEERFHQIQKDRTHWIEAKNRFQEVERAYAELTSFGESVQSIESAVRASLIEKLEEETPGLSENLTQAFVALTHHVWYDQLIIDKSRLPTLELLVASSQDPSGLGSPIDVLNGQAEGALDLVPYFAFSQADNSPVEVHLVMLDDPTRAFDEDHIQSLIESLSQLGGRVQLIVASQEADRFRALLPGAFEPESYSIIEPHGWSFHGGPELEVQYA